MKMTTSTGGTIASTAVVMAMFHSVSASVVVIIFLMPITIVCIELFDATKVLGGIHARRRQLPQVLHEAT